MNFRVHADRRGMLLLMVLSLLTLFLLMGTTFLVLATRARTTARAFMTATSDIQSSPSVPRAVLKESLLMLLRGCQDDDDPARDVGVLPGESLLGDMYGADGERRPFLNEWHDAFNADDFLTEATIAGVTKPAYAAAGAAVEVDNDADGVPDGVWLQNLFPKLASSSGGTLSFKVSYLVLDLDARVNVNAHGGGSGNPLDPTKPYGPADVDLSTLPPFANGGWPKVMDGGIANGGGVGPLRTPPSLSLTREIAGRGVPTYDLRLARGISRPAVLPKANPPAQNPFTYGELERVLRPFDADWLTLPPRLASFLSDLDVPGTARWLVTTDSWDVTCMVGDAAKAATAAGNAATPRFDLTQPNTKQDYATALYNAIANVSGANAITAQWVANVAEHRDTSTAPTSLTIGGFPVTGVSPTTPALATTGPWGNGFVSVGDLLAIPRGNKADIEAIDLTVPLPPGELALHSLVTSHPAILDAVMVPSRFAATILADPSREPGRVNVNTCSPPVWNAVVGGVGPPGRPGSPYKSMWELLSNVASGDQNVLMVNRSLANRLASTATVRSNVFAVWITVEAADSAPDAGPPTKHRLFAIVDRSIPVQYQKGRNNDVRQTVRLERFLN